MNVSNGKFKNVKSHDDNEETNAIQRKNQILSAIRIS